MGTLYIRIKTEEQLRAVRKAAGAGEVKIIADPLAFEAEIADLPEVFRADLLKNESEKLAERMKKAEGAVVKNIDEIGFLKSAGFEGEVIADASLYAYNQEAAALYRNAFENIKFICPDELDDTELKELIKLSGGKDLFIYKIYGRQLLMTSAQSLGESYADGAEDLKFKNEKGEGFIFLWNEAWQYASILSEKPTAMFDKMNEAGFENILIDLTCENEKETARIFEYLRTGEMPEHYIRGHHYKGID